MANPNISANTSIKGNTKGTKLGTTSLTDCLSNPSSSGVVYKINSIIAANVDGVSGVDVSVTFYDGTLPEPTDYYLTKTLLVPADSTQIILTKENYLYLTENTKIRAQAGTANGIDIIISYEEISE